MIRNEDCAALASDHFVHVRHGFFEGHVTRRDHDDGKIFLDERDRPVFEFSGGIALGVNVGYFLELERALQRKPALSCARAGGSSVLARARTSYSSEHRRAPAPAAPRRRPRARPDRAQPR